VQFDNRIVDADAGKRREQVLGGGDEHTLLHQAGGVTDAGHIASAGFDGEAVEVGAAEYDSRSGRRGQNPQADRSTAVQTYSGAGHLSTNCLLVCQGGRLCKSFAVYQLTVIRRLMHVAKRPHSVARSAAENANLFRELQMFGGIQGRTRLCLRYFRKCSAAFYRLFSGMVGSYVTAASNIASGSFML